ncbi:hypothetical protein D3C80_1199620 [compost metagenome]
MDFLPVQFCGTQRLQHRDRRAARQAYPVAFDIVVNVLFDQCGQHLRTGAHPDGIIGVNKPLAAFAVHFGAFRQPFFQRILHHKQR